MIRMIRIVLMEPNHITPSPPKTLSERSYGSGLSGPLRSRYVRAPSVRLCSISNLIAPGPCR